MKVKFLDGNNLVRVENKKGIYTIEKISDNWGNFYCVYQGKKFSHKHNIDYTDFMQALNYVVRELI